jgi:hypothetical protein
VQPINLLHSVQKQAEYLPQGEMKFSSAADMDRLCLGQQIAIVQ